MNTKRHELRKGKEMKGKKMDLPGPGNDKRMKSNRGKGYDALWLWFGLSRSSFLTLPRVLMHEMPDGWQRKMAALLDEWDESWKGFPDVDLFVVAKQQGRFVKVPESLSQYRHPMQGTIDRMRERSNNNQSAVPTRKKGNQL